MAYTFSIDQQNIIDSRNQNLLVSAAAGSGKTSVLTERIVGRVLGTSGDNKDRVDIDRFLVVTFTKAAAREMKERIGKRLSAAIKENPDDSHIAKQAALIHNAQITTIDGFCLNVVRNHFTKIGVDPSFRTASDGEIKLIKEDVLKDVMKRAYESKDEDFYHAIDCFSKKDDDKFEDIIMRVYEFAMSYPYPKEWLREKKEDTLFGTVEEFERSTLAEDIKKAIIKELDEVLLLIDRLHERCNMPGGADGYIDTVESDYEKVKDLRDKLSNQSFSESYFSFNAFSFDRLKGKNSCAPEEVEYFKEVRGKYTDRVKKMGTLFFALPVEEYVSNLVDSAGITRKILDLAEDFYDSFSRVKREKGIIDFGDMEHMAVEILVDSFDKEGNLVISDVAKSYRDYFAEVMVDEYQDSNHVQELIIRSVSKEDDESSPNRFMVGDVKQSIYRFRLARPEIFMGKFENYSKDVAAKSRLITLKENFRSRQSVIDSVNAVFERTMHKEIGGVEYDEDARLNRGGTFTEDTEANKTEIILLDTDEKIELKRGYEADLVAEKIKSLVGHMQVSDKNGGLRPARYSDIAVLFRAPRKWQDAIKESFDKYSIPFYLEGTGTLYDTTEAKEVISFLKLLDNPLDDIACYAAMTSFFGKFTDEECARIRALSVSSERFFFLKVKNYAAFNSDDKKVADFLAKVDKYRRLSKVIPIHELIQRLYEESGIREAYLAKPNGVQRLANLNMLVLKAADYGKTSFFGLFNFLRYLELIKKLEQDEGEPGVLDENSDVVRVMSIHKSKGLEFPICIISGIDESILGKDISGEVVCDVDLGIGVPYINVEKRYKRNTLKKSSVILKIKEETIGEEIRILYVAMTRAKEKLILTGICKDADSWFEKTVPVSYSTYLDMIMEAVNTDDKGIFVKQSVVPDDLEAEAVKEDISRALLRTELENKKTSVDSGLLESINERFSFVYPYAGLKKLYTKTTVSELKMAAIEKEEAEAAHPFEENEPKETIPLFAGGVSVTKGTDRGTAYHNLLELIRFEDISGDEESIRATLKAQIEEIIAGGRMSASDIEKVNLGKIITFLMSDTGAKMTEAAKDNKLFKEQPFVIGVPASEVSEEFPSDETVLVQGVIDVFFIKDGKVTVLDYKTDRVNSGEELIKRYKKQLVYYSQAIHTLTGLSVEEMLIYSFALNDTFVIK